MRISTKIVEKSSRRSALVKESLQGTPSVWQGALALAAMVRGIKAPPDSVSLPRGPVMLPRL